MLGTAGVFQRIDTHETRFYGQPLVKAGVGRTQGGGILIQAGDLGRRERRFAREAHQFASRIAFEVEQPHRAAAGLGPQGYLLQQTPGQHVETIAERPGGDRMQIIIIEDQ